MEGAIGTSNIQDPTPDIQRHANTQLASLLVER
jgi:hypothetical protein